MTKEKLVEILNDTNLPYAYHHFAEGEAPKLPYLIYYYPESDNFGADDTVYHRALDLTIELYTEKRDFEKEWNLEETFFMNDLFWQKHEVYLETEKMYQVSYEMEAAVMG